MAETGGGAAAERARVHKSSRATEPKVSVVSRSVTSSSVAAGGDNTLQTITPSNSILPVGGKQLQGNSTAATADALNRVAPADTLGNADAAAVGGNTDTSVKQPHQQTGQNGKSMSRKRTNPDEDGTITEVDPDTPKWRLLVNKILQREMLDRAWALSENESVTEEMFARELGDDLDRLMYDTLIAFENGITPGYGQLVPATVLGKLVCVAYALFGIPLTLITISDLAKFASYYMARVYRKYKYTKRYMQRHIAALRKDHSATRAAAAAGIMGMNIGAKERLPRGDDPANTSLLQKENDAAAVERKESVKVEETEQGEEGEESESDDSALDAGIIPPEDIPPAITIVGFILLYTAIGALAFTLFEHWNFFDSFYFFFITMITVGFGDLTPTVELFMPVSIAIIVFGLILTTMFVDLVGGSMMDKVHFTGRANPFAKGALSYMRNIKLKDKKPAEIVLITEDGMAYSPLAPGIKYIDQYTSSSGMDDHFSSIDIDSIL